MKKNHETTNVNQVKMIYSRIIKDKSNKCINKERKENSLTTRNFFKYARNKNKNGSNNYNQQYWLYYEQQEQKKI